MFLAGARQRRCRRRVLTGHTGGCRLGLRGFWGCFGGYMVPFEAFLGCFEGSGGVVRGWRAVFDWFGVMIRRYSTVFDRFEMALEWFQTVDCCSTPTPNQEQSPWGLLETTFYRANDPFQPPKHPQKPLERPQSRSGRRRRGWRAARGGLLTGEDIASIR